MKKKSVFTMLKNSANPLAALSRAITGCLLITLTAANANASCTGSVVSNPSNATVCQGGTVTFTASTGTSYLWNTGATTQSIMANATGYYRVTITDGQGCSATVQKYATILAATGSVASSPSNATACQGSSVMFSASGGTSYSWNTGETTAQISASSTGYYKVTITNSNGCTMSIQKYATILAPSGSVSANPPNATTCQGDSITFTANNGTNFHWSTGAQTPQISVRSTGYYSVTMTNSNGCNQVITKYATFNAPTGSVNAYPQNATVCAGGTVTFTANGGTYNWSNGASSASIVAQNTGYYTVTITNSNGCKKVIQKYANISPSPTPTIEYTGPQPKVGDTVALSANGGNGGPYTFQWSQNGVMMQQATSNYIIVSVGSNTATYCVTITNGAGCSGVACKTVGPNGVHRDGNFDEPNSTSTALSKTLNATTYPNPFNDEVMIKYSLEKQDQVSITLMDITGKIVGRPIDVQNQIEGLHEYKLNASDYQLKTGMYILKITSSSNSEILKLNYSGK